jgi:hypothetical protein
MRASGGENFLVFGESPVRAFLSAALAGLPIVSLLTVLVGVPVRWLSARAPA